MDIVYFMTRRAWYPFGRGGLVEDWEEKDNSPNELMNYLITAVFVEQPLALPGSAKDTDTKPETKECCVSLL